MTSPSFGELLLGAYLRWTGKRHLIPLLKSLKHAGRPSDIAFPTELVDQGLSLVLAGLNNTLAMQGNSSWVWPWWAERQIDPGSESFLPTGTNVIKSNLTARNWTALGVDGSRREAMIDPVGMVTLRPYGWSWFPYLRVDGANFFPPRLAGVSQELLEDTLPVVVTRYPSRPDIDWSSECLALRALGEAEGAGRSGGPEWLLCTHRIRNLSARPLTLTFGVALRPYNPLMFSPIGALRYEKASGNAHENGVFRVNGKPALVLVQPPHRVTLSNRWQGDSLLYPDRGFDNARLDSNSGVLSAAAEYPLTLEPGEERELHTVGVIARRAHGKTGAMKPSGTPAAAPDAAFLARLRDMELTRLRAVQADGLGIEIPHAGLEKAFRAVKGRLHVFDDGDRFSPGSFLYHGHWFRDAAFIALAFDQMGFGDRVAIKTEANLKRQDWRGFFRSQNGEWDSNGQALWTLIGHVQRGGDPALLAQAWPALWKGGLWIERMRQKTREKNSRSPHSSPHFGLLPAGFSAEHFGPNDHYYWDNLWSLAGLEKLLWAARLLGRTREAARLEARLAAYRAEVEGSMTEAFRRAGGEGLPCSPYRDMDSAAVGNLVGLSPLGVVSPRAEWVSGTVEFLARNNLREGLFLQKIIHTGLNPYLSAQLARALLLRQDPRAFTVLESLLRHGGPTHAWPEAIHPRTGGGCMGDGDHGWAAAEFLNLVRDILVREENGLAPLVLLASGAPASWFRAGRTIAVHDAPTLHGTVSYRVAILNTATGDVLSVEWTCRRAAHQDHGEVVLCLPLSFARAAGIPGTAYGPHLRVSLTGESGHLLFKIPPSNQKDRGGPETLSTSVSKLTGRMSHA